MLGYYVDRILSASLTRHTACTVQVRIYLSWILTKPTNIETQIKRLDKNMKAAANISFYFLYKPYDDSNQACTIPDFPWIAFCFCYVMLLLGIDILWENNYFATSL